MKGKELINEKQMKGDQLENERDPDVIVNGHDG